jgi:hypothetical protein
MILDIIGYVLADRRQLKQLVLDDRIVGLLGKLPIRPGISGRFLTLRPARIDQRHILKLLVRKLIYAGGGVKLLQRGHSSGSGGQLGRMRPQHGGRGGD